ncbi:hypothetical protein ABT039_07640 [Streptomyces lasiicapitis]|uniref:hypothetical protein n=1 Tax=Streptomyces lasiicapitis TaxID=1923961 RepID=UPI00331F66A4
MTTSDDPMTTSETSARRRTAGLSAARGAAGTVCARADQGTQIPPATGLRAGPFTVSAVGAKGVDLTSVDATGFTSSLLGQRPDQGGPSTVNELSIAVLAIAGDTATLRLFPAE